jgi:hypothetical protein
VALIVILIFLGEKIESNMSHTPSKPGKR